MKFSTNHNQFLTARRVELKVAVIIYSAVTDSLQKTMAAVCRFIQ